MDESRYRPLSPSELRSVDPSRPLAWQDYATLWLDAPLGRFLDYGCGPGVMLRRVAPLCEECWGVDVDTSQAQKVTAPNIRIREIDPDAALPFEDGYFDTISIQEVIEHVSDERRVLRELCRVLKPGGRLVLTTPHKGLLTWMDPANVKFVAPGFHRVIHTLMGNRDYYERSFGETRRAEKGMIADFTLDQNPWHRHYRYEEIRALAPPELRTVKWGVYYPGMRFFWLVNIGLKFVTRGRYRGDVPWPMQPVKYSLSRTPSRAGDQLVILFEKAG